MVYLSVIVVCLAQGAGHCSEAKRTIVLSSSPAAINGIVRSDSGKVTLHWNFSEERNWPTSAESDFILEQAPSDEFAEVLERYRGVDRSSVITGLAEGTYFFRVKTVEPSKGSLPPRSKHLKVEVAYMERGLVSLLLIVGGLVFLMTISAIFGGHRQVSRNDPQTLERKSS